MIIDKVKIYVKAGDGGNGAVSFRREKYVSHGGPDGGDGGNGGSVILRGNRNYWTLLHLRYDRHVRAEHGGNGGRDKCHGTNGKHAYIEVPCGTVVYNAETGKYVCDVTYDGQEVVLLKGGRGGLGNFQFRTSTNQAPRYAQPGEPMQEMTVILELKLLADVGLVGFPTAGKSTLVSALSNAKPKIANYPFTTMEPSLGIVAYHDHKSFVMADIPGIIEGASEGKGLGLRFLRHIERNSLLLFMVPGDTDDIKKEYIDIPEDSSSDSVDPSDSSDDPYEYNYDDPDYTGDYHEEDYYGMDDPGSEMHSSDEEESQPSSDDQSQESVASSEVDNSSTPEKSEENNG